MSSEDRICAAPDCNAVIVGRAHSEYCSQRCYKRVWQRQNRAANRKPKVVQCAYNKCQRTFEKHRNRIFCSDECYKADYLERRRNETAQKLAGKIVVCSICSRAVPQTFERQKTCLAPACIEKHHDNIRKKWEAENGVKWRKDYRDNEWSVEHVRRYYGLTG